MHFAKQHTRQSKQQHGFTLMEIMVAFAIFAVVAVSATGAFLSLVDANRKAQSIESAVNNLNFALDSMVREIRVGTAYRCHPSTAFPASQMETPRNCPNGRDTFVFEQTGGMPGDSDDQWAYRLEDEQIERSTDGGDSFIGLTAPEVVIETLEFYVTGAERGVLDSEQPRVRIVVSGRAGTGDTETEFTIQTTAVQRLLDF